MALTAGTRLGRYEIRAKIGAGGMGELYRTDNSRNFFTAEAITLQVPGNGEPPWRLLERMNSNVNC